MDDGTMNDETKNARPTMHPALAWILAVLCIVLILNGVLRIYMHATGQW